MRIREFSIRASQILCLALWVMILAMIFTGCGEPGTAQAACTGTVMDKYSTSKTDAGVVISGIIVPGATHHKFYVVLKQADGVNCERKLDKDVWLQADEGETISE